MPSRKVKFFLDQSGIKYDLIDHDTVYTAQEVAAVTHVRGRELAKAVVVKTEDGLLLAAVPSTAMIDFDLLKKALGKDNVELAREEDFMSYFPDCEVGAMPPLGKLYHLDVVADSMLMEDEEIVFNAGTHHDIIRIAMKDFVQIEHPRIARITTTA